MNEFLSRMYIIMIKMNTLYLDISSLLNAFISVTTFFPTRDPPHLKCQRCVTYFTKDIFLFKAIL